MGGSSIFIRRAILSFGVSPQCRRSGPTNHRLLIRHGGYTCLPRCRNPGSGGGLLTASPDIPPRWIRLPRVEPFDVNDSKLRVPVRHISPVGLYLENSSPRRRFLGFGFARHRLFLMSCHRLWSCAQSPIPVLSALEMRPTYVADASLRGPPIDNQHRYACHVAFHSSVANVTSWGRNFMRGILVATTFHTLNAAVTTPFGVQTALGPKHTR